MVSFDCLPDYGTQEVYRRDDTEDLEILCVAAYRPSRTFFSGLPPIVPNSILLPLLTT